MDRFMVVDGVMNTWWSIDCICKPSLSLFFFLTKLSPENKYLKLYLGV